MSGRDRKQSIGAGPLLNFFSFLFALLLLFLLFLPRQPPLLSSKHGFFALRIAAWFARRRLRLALICSTPICSNALKSASRCEIRPTRPCPTTTTIRTTIKTTARAAATILPPPHSRVRASRESSNSSRQATITTTIRRLVRCRLLTTISRRTISRTLSILPTPPTPAATAIAVAALLHLVLFPFPGRPVCALVASTSRRPPPASSRASRQRPGRRRRQHPNRRRRRDHHSARHLLPALSPIRHCRRRQIETRSKAPLRCQNKHSPHHTITRTLSSPLAHLQTASIHCNLSEPVVAIGRLACEL